MNKLENLIIDLPRITDPRGNLTFVEHCKGVPFEIKRTYWVYDVPGGESRGGHSHKQCKEFIIAAGGSFDVTLNDGENKKTYHLNRPWQGLLVETGVWRTLENFSSGALCLVLASEKFDEADYIRDFDEFIKSKQCLK